jgi:hypothetical protein
LSKPLHAPPGELGDRNKMTSARSKLLIMSLWPSAAISKSEAPSRNKIIELTVGGRPFFFFFNSAFLIET